MVAAQLGISRGERDRLCWAALLHDVGRLEIAVSILNKPGALNASEWERMRRHPADGARLCAPLLAWLGPSGHGILEHHEKYDGNGYPNGLSGDHISLAGRVISVVDAYETMTAARPYKKPLTTRAAREEVAKCASSHLDPVIVRAFLAVSVPRLMWATGPLSLLTHLPYLRELQIIGTQPAAVSASSAAQAAGVTALAVATAVLPMPGSSTVPPTRTVRTRATRRSRA
jgi:HD domain-containing protein